MIYGRVFIEYALLIYEYNQSKQRIRNTDISKLLGVARPTVTHKLKNMIKEEYVQKDISSLELTSKGISLCNRILKVLNHLNQNLQMTFDIKPKVLYEWSLHIVANSDFEELERTLENRI